jgi:hypothetical protein
MRAGLPTMKLKRGEVANYGQRQKGHQHGTGGFLEGRGRQEETRALGRTRRLFLDYAQRVSLRLRSSLSSRHRGVDCQHGDYRVPGSGPETGLPKSS